MWLITNFGFFSVVEKPDDPKLGTLTIRSMVREGLESLLFKDKFQYHGKIKSVFMGLFLYYSVTFL